MKVSIKRQQCVGNARCNSIAEHLYFLDGDGYIATEGFHVDADQEKLARMGAKGCPERVIVVTEDDGTQSWPPQ